MSRTEFSAKTKALAFLRAAGYCENQVVDEHGSTTRCGAKLTVGKFHYDHIVADGLRKDSSLENCAVLCIQCHKDKTARDVPAIAKAKRLERTHRGIKKPRSITSWRRFDGTIVRKSRER